MLFLPVNAMAQKGAEFGLYKPKPKIVLVYQVDAKVLLECLKKNPKRPLYIVIPVCYLNISLLDYLLVYFPLLLSLWYFGFLCAHTYTFTSLTVDNLSGTVNKFHLTQKCFCEWAIILHHLTDSHFSPKASWWASIKSHLVAAMGWLHARLC